MVPPANFTSYYGRPVIKPPVWTARDIAGYFFTGGLAGGTAVLAAGADLTGRPVMRRFCRGMALGAITLSFVGLIDDLGKPARFVHMLRVVRPSSPMSIGTWLLAGFGPATALAAGSEVAGALPLPRTPRDLLRASGRPAGLAAATMAPFVMTYTGALVSDTAVPVWHEAHREMPYVFGASAVASAGGWAVATSPRAEVGPAYAFALTGAVADLALTELMKKRLGMVAEPLESGRAGTLMKAATWTTASGAGILALAGWRSRTARILGGTALLAGSALARFGIFEAGKESAADPKYTVVPQRERLQAEGPFRA